MRASFQRSSVSDHTYQSPFGPVGIRARLLEPRMVGRRVVHDEVGDHAHAALVRLLDELLEVVDRPVVGMDREEVGDVVAAVPQRRLVHRQQPDAVDAEPLQVVELVDQPAEVAAAVVVAVEEAADVDLVEDRVLEPERIALEPLLDVHVADLTPSGRAPAPARAGRSCARGATSTRCP